MRTCHRRGAQRRQGGARGHNGDGARRGARAGHADASETEVGREGCRRHAGTDG